MAYSTKQRNLVPRTDVVAKQSPPGRLRNTVLDVLTLPLVVAGPRRQVEVVGVCTPLDYGFRKWFWRNERCVEVAVGKRVIQGRDPAGVLELGNVLGPAGQTGHTVVDKYEVGPGVVNVDIMEFQPARRFDLAISISTLEHVGFDEYPQELDKAGRALAHLASLADDLLVTIPVGYHRQLEQDILDGPFDEVELIAKTSRRARWERRPLEETAEFEYSAPYAHGNAVLVGSRGIRRSSVPS